MSETLTDTGLKIPAECSDEELVEIGQEITRREGAAQENLMMVQWHRGEWWNVLPKGKKEAMCERAGAFVETAKKCGSIVFGAKKSNVALSHVQSFKHLRILLHQELTDHQRQGLLEKSMKNEWTSARLRHERDKLLGRPEKIPLLSFDEKREKVLATLPASISKKARQAVDELISKLKHDFQHELHLAVEERLKEDRRHIHEIKAEALAELDRAKNYCQSLDGMMTEAEYKAVRACLHPDRAPAEKKDQFTKAFDIFNRLKDTVNYNMPARLRKDRGWAA